MNFNQFVSKVHFYLGLQALLALILFALSTFATTFDRQQAWQTSTLVFSGEPATGRAQLAKQLHEQVALPFERAPSGWMISGDASNSLLLKYISPHGKRNVRLDIPARHIEIHSQPLGVTAYLNRMHTESFGRRAAGDSLWLWAWSAYLELSLLALFVLPATGLYIWLTRNRAATGARFTLFASLSVMAGLYFYIG